MSYDLMVFDPAVAPTSRSKFMEWYAQQIQWTEGHSYDDPVVTTEELEQWYRLMKTEFPPMNGPDRSGDEDDPKLADYSIGKSVIYSCFAWSQAEDAYEAARRAAVIAGVGFFHASGYNEEPWFPERKVQSKPSFWKRLFGLS